MRALIVAGILCALGAVSPSQALAADDAMARLGRQMCGLALEGHVAQVDGASARKALAADGRSEADFCACTGEMFNVNASAQGPRMAAAGTPDDETRVLGEILSENMGACMPDGEEERALAAAAAAAEAEVDQGDVDMCMQLAEGGAIAPGFDTEAIARRAISVGMDLDALCGCVGHNMIGTAAQIEEQGAARGDYSRIWLQLLGQRMDDCASHM